MVSFWRLFRFFSCQDLAYPRNRPDPGVTFRASHLNGVIFRLYRQQRYDLTHGFNNQTIPVFFFPTFSNSFTILFFLDVGFTFFFSNFFSCKPSTGKTWTIPGTVEVAEGFHGQLQDFRQRLEAQLTRWLTNHSVIGSSLTSTGNQTLTNLLLQFASCESCD